MVGKAVARYIRDNDIAQRVSGKHKWTVEVRDLLALDILVKTIVGQVACFKNEECTIGASVESSRKLVVEESEQHALLLLSATTYLIAFVPCVLLIASVLSSCFPPLPHL